MIIAIRFTLTGVLLYFVYGETGWATTLMLGLSCANAEMIALSRRLYRGGAKDLVDAYVRGITK